MKNSLKTLPDSSYLKLKKIRESFTSTPSYEAMQYDIPKFTSFCPSIESEVHAVIMKMKNKHCKLDIIPTSILKQILDACLPAITQIVNLSLTNGELCEDWKAAVVKPLLKKPGLDLISKNYRPISNLPFISKLVEKCMLKQLLKHCKNTTYFLTFSLHIRNTITQRPASSDSPMTYFWSMEKQHIISLTIHDLLAAFNLVDHDILLQILEQKFGFRDKALKWFLNYLRPWSFRSKHKLYVFKAKWHGIQCPGKATAVEPTSSPTTAHSSQTPYNHPWHSGLPDDHSIRKSFPAKCHTVEINTISTMENTLIKIANWMTSMQLKLNSEKTKFIMFSSKQMLKHADTWHLNFGTTPIHEAISSSI